MKSKPQFPLDLPPFEPSSGQDKNSVRSIHLLSFRPIGLDETWHAFLWLCGTSEPTVCLACPGVTDGVQLSVDFIADAALHGMGFAFFGPFGRRESKCSGQDAIALLLAVVQATPLSAGKFKVLWVADDPRVPF